MRKKLQTDAKEAEIFDEVALVNVPHPQALAGQIAWLGEHHAPTGNTLRIRLSYRFRMPGRTRRVILMGPRKIDRSLFEALCFDHVFDAGALCDFRMGDENLHALPV